MKKAVVGLSGGVDSAVAALLLQNEGYEVHGLGLVTSPSYQRAAKKAEEVAAQLGIPFTTLDVQKDFSTKVIEPFARSYQQGETPSPCLDCNRTIKWHYLLSFADGIGADYVATGHYARILKNKKDLFELHKGLDTNKDQAYMLSRLGQAELSRTLMPLGTLSKDEVRTLATERGLNIPKSEESQDLCFLEGTDYRSFLETQFDFRESPGLIQTPEGKVIGEHQGLSNYTIGQRKGLPAYQHPLYVIEKNTTENLLIVGGVETLGKNRFMVRDLHMISGETVRSPLKADVKIRYRAKAVPCLITPLSSRTAEIQTETLLRDVTPGQFAVFYNGDQVLGSGVITQ